MPPRLIPAGPRWRTIALFTLSGVLAAGVLVLAAAVAARDVQQVQDPQHVANEWREAMNALGINSVFPPTEDLHVGDIYAVDDGLPDDISSKKPLGRTMVIGHAAGTEALLKRTYQGIPRFPPSPKAYDGVSPVESEGHLFDAGGDLKALPIVAFPGVTVSTANATMANALIPRLRGLLGAQRSASQSMHVRIPQAETYGIYAADAADLLESFCHPSPNAPIRDICTDDGLRAVLSSRDPDILATGPKRHHVSLQLIYRVYLTRAIDYVYGAETAVGASIAEQRGKGRGKDPASESGDDQVSLHASTSDEADFKVTLPRPVVIGYVTIKTDPWPTPATTTARAP
jgi:hypothetical protein